MTAEAKVKKSSAHLNKHENLNELRTSYAYSEDGPKQMRD